MTTIVYEPGKMSKDVFMEKMTNVKVLNKKQCWQMVNRIDDFQKLKIAMVWVEKALNAKSITNLEWNDLMMALSYISRELFHEKQKRCR